MRCTNHFMTAPARRQCRNGAASIAYIGSQKISVKKEKQAIPQMMGDCHDTFIRLTENGQNSSNLYVSEKQETLKRTGVT